MCLENIPQMCSLVPNVKHRYWRPSVTYADVGITCLLLVTSPETASTSQSSRDPQAVLLTSSGQPRISNMEPVLRCLIFLPRYLSTPGFGRGISRSWCRAGQCWGDMERSGDAVRIVFALQRSLRSGKKGSFDQKRGKAW